MFKRVGVIGCGLMGSGIAEVCARAGCQVVVREVSEDLLRRGLGRIDSSLARGVERGKLTDADRQAARGRIRGTTALGDLGGCEILLEAIIEKMSDKMALYAELDAICPPEALFASNTSSLSITEMASVTKRPERFLGLHFFNPVPVMRPVEMVRGLLTAEETLVRCRAFCEALGKTVVACKDYPGFIVNLLLVPYLLDAVRALELGVASREDIDEAVRLGLNHPMGPLTLLDFVGIDTTYYIAEAMFEEFKDARYAAPPLMRKMVVAGCHGRKSGKGFYEYAKPS
ncbi:MAG TPA: 3-hydroxybutyryl-CoA dehydrogenase [bacterium]|nr:3-hydroxybutyryl-CoA dehydrogenase [bacterium]